MEIMGALAISLALIICGCFFGIMQLFSLLLTDGPWTKEDTKAVVAPVWVALSLVLCVWTFGLPILAVFVYKARQKLKHPDSKIL